MCKENHQFVFIAAAFAGLAILLVAFASPPLVYANGSAPEHGNCVNCHENLYYLHDTGKFFCLKESPMACVDCHGGDSSANLKELAHASRDAHPVINGDITKCRECHPDQCVERVQIFGQVAGISPVLVAASYAPVSVISGTSSAPAAVGEQSQVGALHRREAISVAALVILLSALVLVSILRNRKEPA